MTLSGFQGDRQHAEPRPSGPVYLKDPGGGRPPRTLAPSMHTTLAAVDIVAFGERYRDTLAQLHIRHALYEALLEAFTLAGLPWWDCHREDRGDGVLIVTPPDVDAGDFLEPLARHLTAGLSRHNRHTESTRLQLRMAVHQGHVSYDAHGVTGPATTHLFRLLEARAFKKALRAAGSDLGLIVSDQLFTQAAGHSGPVDGASYRQLRLTCKETRRIRAWLWLGPSPP